MRTHEPFGILCLTVVLTCSLAAGPLLAGTPAYDKGFADGKTFGARSGQKKGYADGYQQGLDDGHKKGMADAEAGMDDPAPPVPPTPPADEPPAVEPPAVEPPAVEPPADEPPAVEPPAVEPPADEPPADEPPAEEPPVSEPPADETTGRASLSAETLTEEALRTYPHLLPRAPSLEGLTDEVVTDPADDKGLVDGLIGGNGIISDEDLAYSTDYSKGFALGYLEGYKQTYASARDEGYQKGYAEGYQKGKLEFQGLHYGADGQPLTAEQQYRKGRALLMQEKWEDAITRFDLVAATGFDNEWVDDALYWKAWACYNTKQFVRAIKTVSQMLEILSDSELADDALYCQGMSYEYLQSGGFLGMGAKKHYVEAAECFYTLIARYPSSPIIPNAYFRLGFNYERLRDKKAAVKAYRVIMTQYPNSSVAFKATQRLKALGAWQGPTVDGE